MVDEIEDRADRKPELVLRPGVKAAMRALERTSIGNVKSEALRTQHFQPCAWTS
jgi:hypothetical protein